MRCIFYCILLFDGVYEILWFVFAADVATGTDSRQSSVKKSVIDVAAYGRDATFV